MATVRRGVRGYAGAALRKVGLAPTPTRASSPRTPVPSQPTSQERVARERQEFDAGFMRSIAAGEPLADAVVRYAREASTTRYRAETLGMFQRLVDDPIASQCGCLGFATFLCRDGLAESALVWFTRGGVDLALDHAAPEYLDVLYHSAGAAEADPVASLIINRGGHVAPADRLQVIAVLAKFGRIALLSEAARALTSDDAARGALDEKEADSLAWMLRMVAEVDLPAAETNGAISFAVMDYKLPDRSRTPQNRGDFVQTLAAAAHLLRFTGVEFVGGSELANYLTSLKPALHEDRRIEGVSARVMPVTLDRDFASGRRYPDNTWLICNGWFMRRAFNGPVDFPFPAQVNPIMISFHIQEPDILTDEVIASLRECEPIGCRDWTSVYRLRDVGVECFFSGCVTTTVGQVLDPAKPMKQKRLADVEGGLTPEEYEGWSVDTFIQVGPQVRDFTVVEAMEDARTMLNEYASYDTVATSRLHCYLPTRSMGLTVDFRPKNKADIRFEGLLDLTPEAFGAIRTGIDDKLEHMLRAILGGASREEVYAQWREITAADVAAANEYCENYPEHLPSAIDVPLIVAGVAGTKATYGGVSGDKVVDVAFSLDQNLTEVFPAVLQSLVDSTKRPVRCQVLGRGLAAEYYERLHALFPQLELTFYNLSDVVYSEGVATLSHISPSTLDRLLLPELLPELPQIVYLDVDVLVQGDVGELFDLDLGHDVVAGRREKLPVLANLVRPITRASLHLPPEQAWQMRRRLHAVSDLTGRTFNAGVLVLNLAAMRAEAFTAESLALVEQCWLNDQDVLNVYSRDRLRELDPAWNVVPSQDSELDPRIIHWAGPGKPWHPQYVLFRDRFDAAVETVAQRERALAASA